MTDPKAKSIVERLNGVMKDVGGVEKKARAAAAQGGYAYRSIDDVMAALQPALIKNGVVVRPEVIEIRENQYTTKGGTQMNRVVLKVCYRFLSIEGEYVNATVTGEGADAGDKACNKALAGAMKYAVTQTLSIPTSEVKDSEADLDDPPAPQRKKAARSPAPPPSTEPPPLPKEWKKGRVEGTSNFKDKTWRYMLDGKVGGGRHSYLINVGTKLSDKPPDQLTDVMRLWAQKVNICLKVYSAKADAEAVKEQRDRSAEPEPIPASEEFDG